MAGDRGISLYISPFPYAFPELNHILTQATIISLIIPSFQIYQGGSQDPPSKLLCRPSLLCGRPLASSSPIRNSTLAFSDTIYLSKYASPWFVGVGRGVRGRRSTSSRCPLLWPSFRRPSFGSSRLQYDLHVAILQEG